MGVPVGLGLRRSVPHPCHGAAGPGPAGVIGGDEGARPRSPPPPPEHTSFLLYHCIQQLPLRFCFFHARCDDTPLQTILRNGHCSSSTSPYLADEHLRGGSDAAVAARRFARMAARQPNPPGRSSNRSRRESARTSDDRQDQTNFLGWSNKQGGRWSGYVAELKGKTTMFSSDTDLS